MSVILDDRSGIPLFVYSSGLSEAGQGLECRSGNRMTGSMPMNSLSKALLCKARSGFTSCVWRHSRAACEACAYSRPHPELVALQRRVARAGRRSVQPVHSDAAIRARPPIKVLVGLPLRRTTGFVASLLKLAGLAWPVPDRSTLSRRQKTLAVQFSYRGAGRPLHLLVDNEALSASGPGTMPNGSKVRGEASEQANATGARETANGSGVGDAPMLPGLLS